MFSKSTEYALRATLYIAQKGSEEKNWNWGSFKSYWFAPVIYSKNIAVAQKDNKIICSISGPHGGFYMTEKAKNLPVRVILEAMDEDELLDRCVLGLEKCSEAKPCPMHLKYKIIKKQLNDLFEKATVLHLANDIKTGDVFMKSK